MNRKSATCTLTHAPSWLGLATCLVLVLASASPAQAAWGYASGRFTFTQDQQNCGTGTGVKFPCSWVGQTRGVRFAEVEVRRASDGSPLGTGFTDGSGNWSLSWEDEVGPNGGGSVVVTLHWFPHQRDDRFRIRTAAGNLVTFTAATQVTLQSYTQQNPSTAVGTHDFGASDRANIYDGAIMMWENSLNHSARLRNHFGVTTPSGSGATKYVSIRTRVNDGTCPTGGAFVALNRICLSSFPNDHAPLNHHRVMHEMGHIADNHSSRNQVRGTRANTALSGLGWGPETDEWHSSQYTEALGTAFANVALYHPNASAPATCDDPFPCGYLAGLGLLFGHMLEPQSGCGAPSRRQPIQAERYFWDLYDSVDPNTSETLSLAVSHLADTNFAFTVGNANRQRDEVDSHPEAPQLTCAAGNVCDPDGYSTIDFMENLRARGYNSSWTLDHNCRPALDARAGTGNGANCLYALCPAVD